VVLDPVSRFRDGDENDNASATRFVEAVEALRVDTGATVLLPHHVSKDGLKAGADALSMDALRGASALVDGVRWAAAMATLGKDAAKEYGVDPEDAGHYVRLDAVKNNYAAPWEGLWLARGPGGVLAPTALEKPAKERQERKAESRYQEILPKLQGLIRQHQEQGEPLTPNRLRDYAGKEGMFGVGDQSLRGIVSRAISEGHIQEKQAGQNKKVLRVCVG
jgi:RecA-family ATPase